MYLENIERIYQKLILDSSIDSYKKKYIID